MPSKKYPAGSGKSIVKAPLIREAKAEPYGRGKNQRRGSQFALTVATLKRHLKKPVKRRKEEIAWALEIAGVGKGPADLSEKMRDYLYSDR